MFETFGVSTLASIVALVIAAVSLYAKPFAARCLSSAALALAGLVFIVSGHAATASPQLLMKPSIFLHTSCVLAWAGSLFPLFVVLGRDRGEAASVLKAYSSPVLFVFTIVIASGLVVAAVQLGALNELWASGYGIVLSAKVALVVPLVGLAAFNRLSAGRRVMSGDRSGIWPLKLAIGGEIVLVVLIFGLTSLWRFIPPPREMSAVTVLSTGVQFHAHGTRGMANVLVSPAKPGLVTVSINVLDVQSRPFFVKNVEFVLLDPDNRIEPIRRNANRVTSSTWQIDQFPIPSPGSWLVRLNLIQTDFEKITVRTTVTIEGP